MAKLHFKPMPGLTVVLAISVAILIALGTWQYQRLQWKTALLAEIDASVTAPPFTSLKEVEQAIANNDPIDFRRVEFSANTLKNTPSYHLYSSQAGGIYWDVVEPVTSDNRTILAFTKELDDIQKRSAPAIVETEQALNVTGYVRKYYPMGRVESWVKSKANSQSNRYFYFNQTGDWYEALPPSRIEGYYVDIAKADSASDLPVLRPDIANNHFDYMLTWYSFALIFVVIYIILHRRAGRLKLT